MAKYRKKFVVEALLWNGKNLREIIAFTGLHESAVKRFNLQESDNWDDYELLVKREGLKIFTLEGPLMADIGDFIIKGINGEVYPCKPDIFEKTYELVEE